MSGSEKTAPADTQKEAAAREAVRLVADGMIVGLGTGSTAAYAVRVLGERVAAGLRITGVATSRQTEAQARSLHIPLTDLNDVERLDLTIDGADEIDPATLNVIKGRGGALLREKLVALATTSEIIVADSTKIAPGGLSQIVPVEVIPFGEQHTARALNHLGARPVLRRADGSPFVTDSGNHIFDCDFGQLTDPPALAAAIKAVPGVVEHGLFIGLVHLVIIAGPDGLRKYE
jgi:ribose 5-phosphate isomerase A